jgi:hypothetical protein
MSDLQRLENKINIPVVIEVSVFEATLLPCVGSSPNGIIQRTDPDKDNFERDTDLLPTPALSSGDMAI